MMIVFIVMEKGGFNMNKYVITNKVAPFAEYACITVETFCDEEQPSHDYVLSYTDRLFDATKFLCVNDAFVILEEVCPNPEDWDVILFEEK